VKSVIGYILWTMEKEAAESLQHAEKKKISNRSISRAAYYALQLNRFLKFNFTNEDNKLICLSALNSADRKALCAYAQSLLGKHYFVKELWKTAHQTFEKVRYGK
jgi:hypothetical protein